MLHSVVRVMWFSLTIQKMKLRNELQAIFYRAKVLESGFFDKKWYLQTYPGVQKSWIDPVVHYLVRGAGEGRDPGPDFSTKEYLSLHRDVAMRKMNPLLHYILFGEREKRQRFKSGMVKTKNCTHLSGLNEKKITKYNQPKNSWPYTISETELLSRVRRYNAQKYHRKAKVVCYTEFNAADDYIIIPETIVNDWDYVVFSKQTIEGEHIFDVRPPVFNHHNPVLHARYLKTHPHILFPGYACSVWIDPAILVRGNYLQETLYKCLNDHTLVMLKAHPGYRTMHERYVASLQLQNKPPSQIEKKIVKYYDEGLPETAVFFDSGIIIRHHMSPEIIDANEGWWHEIIEGIAGDQLSLPYIVWKYHLSVQILNVIKDPLDHKDGDYCRFFNKLSQPGNARRYTMPKFLRILPAVNGFTSDCKELKSNIFDNNGFDAIGIKRKLYRYGFVERVYRDLHDIFINAETFILKQRAAWELALWHINRGSAEDAEECLKFLHIATILNTNEQNKQRAAILKAECYKIMDEIHHAEKVLTDALKQSSSADLFLAMANISVTEEKKIFWFNKVFELYDVAPVSLVKEKRNTDYDRLVTDIKEDTQRSKNTGSALVTIIVPTYNAQDNIRIALCSMLNQTWSNLEIIVADDCSTDNTISIVEAYQKKDKRIKLVHLTQNQGTYVVRNIALKEACGEFVTCNDSDDWSHPQKIEVQVNHLLQNKSIIANTSELIRVTSNLAPYRRGNAGFYIQPNYSSLMFRKKEVMMSLGYWDSVRFGADSEMVYRLKSFFGEESVEYLNTGPLMLALQSEKSLTGDSKFGIHGFIKGARAEYRDCYLDYFENADDWYYDFPMKRRKFPVPEPMKPNREVKTDNRRHLDVVYAFDFRLHGEIIESITREIFNNTRLGKRTGLAQFYIYEASETDYPKINSKIRQIIDGEKVQLLVYGERISCDQLIIWHPAVLMDYQQFIPEIAARAVIVEDGHVAHQVLKDGFLTYDRETCNKSILRYFQKEGEWRCNEKMENE